MVYRGIILSNSKVPVGVKYLLKLRFRESGVTPTSS
jgi:hypothetical protein